MPHVDSDATKIDGPRLARGSVSMGIRCRLFNIASICLATHTCPMQHLISRIISAIVVVGTAAIAALWLADLAHNDLGIPRHTIRFDALLCALLVFGFLVIGLFSGRLDRRG